MNNLARFLSKLTDQIERFNLQTIEMKENQKFNTIQNKFNHPIL